MTPHSTHRTLLGDVCEFSRMSARAPRQFWRVARLSVQTQENAGDRNCVSGVVELILLFLARILDFYAKQMAFPGWHFDTQSAIPSPCVLRHTNSSNSWSEQFEFLLMAITWYSMYSSLEPKQRRRRQRQQQQFSLDWKQAVRENTISTTKSIFVRPIQYE